MRLFYAPPACSLAAMIALEATGRDYEPVEVDLAGDRAALRAKNPSGKVPTLSAGDLILPDTTAIIFWLSRRHPTASLLPVREDHLASALSAMAWFGSVSHIVRRQFARPMLFTDDPAAQAALKESAEPRYWQELERIDMWLAGRGDAVPLPLGVGAYALLFYHWAMRDMMPVDRLPAFTALAKNLGGRDDVRRALVRHQSPLLEIGE
ncbi:glutathione S-transferase family protein [Sphingobium chungangianum]